MTPRPTHKFRVAAAAVGCLAAMLAISCEREERTFRVETPSADATNDVRLIDLLPGPYESPTTRPNEYEENAYAMQQGQTLYMSFNCHGCHAMGGGDIGPPLMDDMWRYGSRPEQVYSTIKQGRPNGMPAFGGKVADYQIWQLVAYVRSMSGLAPKNAAPGRTDHMHNAPPPHTIPTSQPRNSDKPLSVQMPQ